MKRHSHSVPGEYYVDIDACTCSATCVFEAPEHFKVDENDLKAYVFKQPETVEEKILCKKAMLSCPVEAIHNNGKR